MTRPLLLLAGLLATVPALADVAISFNDIAEVVSSRPNVRIEQVERCDTTYQSSQPAASDRGLMGPILGGLTGGLLGKNVGKGSGQQAAMALGAIAGAITGDRMQNDSGAQAAPAVRCRLVDREVTDGYRVQFRYQGRFGETTVQQSPGATLPVLIGVMPR